MIPRQYLYNDWRADDEDDEKEETPKSDLMMFSKKLEKYFFDKRSVYLWGVVDDKSARDVVSKLLLLDADKSGEDIKFKEFFTESEWKEMLEEFNDVVKLDDLSEEEMKPLFDLMDKILNVRFNIYYFT